MEEQGGRETAQEGWPRESGLALAAVLRASTGGHHTMTHHRAGISQAVVCAELAEGMDCQTY